MVMVSSATRACYLQRLQLSTLRAAGNSLCQLLQFSRDGLKGFHDAHRHLDRRYQQVNVQLLNATFLTDNQSESCATVDGDFEDLKR